MAAAHTTANVSTFRDAVLELQKKPTPRYVLFTADDDPTTGLPWCPDCVRAVPAVRAAAARSGAALLEVTLKLTGIPTLLQWGQDGPSRRLGPELEACGSPSEVEKLLQSTQFFSP
ncbi:hypothetical protein GPECTOR_1g87 [Gonium pectorale]|uniref:Thioredoxin domain-containing protein n=1 Tax=Gonium pectorale TaxID=33097 RepID=A0A150H4H4_GONPE|nr:hypothetical protein GPECTOR_1g87 [Gonium pectorale]|eukprot:KXZ56963.1 hypothetical protein GPECTOR_1g87 [Gonium pectorale]